MGGVSKQMTDRPPPRIKEPPKPRERGGHLAPSPSYPQGYPQLGITELSTGCG